MTGRHARRIVVVPIAVALVAACGMILLRPSRPASDPVAGMVRRTETRVAFDATGRLATIPVTPGLRVKRGDVVATLDNPELAASLVEATAAAAAARAERDRVYSGVRAEEVAMADRNVRTAEATLVLAEQQYHRAATLAAQSVTSRQQLDESVATLERARADLALKRAQHAAAAAGPTEEERVLADARVALADASVHDIEAKLEKTRLRAAVDGTVRTVVARPGEVLAAGAPAMTIEAEGPAWFAFTIREDHLDGLTVGSVVTLAVGDGGGFPARVTELVPLGEFATWRAARAVGDHDLNSFRLRLDPDVAPDGLSPGMTVRMRRDAR